MPLESGNTIESLDPSWPLGGDPHNKGDDHIRLIKHVLAAQFPGVAGDGFAIAITATEAEINFLTGASSNIQDQLDAIVLRLNDLEATLSAPVDTAMIFYNASPPIGWVQDTANDNAMLRVVSGAGAGSGGTDSPILNDKTPVHTHTGSSDTMGDHVHILDRAHTHLAGGTAGTLFASQGEYPAGSSSGSVHAAGGHEHSITIDNNAGAANWTPKYVDMVVGVKS